MVSDRHQSRRAPRGRPSSRASTSTSSSCRLVGRVRAVDVDHARAMTSADGGQRRSTWLGSASATAERLRRGRDGQASSTRSIVDAAIGCRRIGRRSDSARVSTASIEARRPGTRRGLADLARTGPRGRWRLIPADAARRYFADGYVRVGKCDADDRPTSDLRTCSRRRCRTIETGDVRGRQGRDGRRCARARTRRSAKAVELRRRVWSTTSHDAEHARDRSCCARLLPGPTLPVSRSRSTRSRTRFGSSLETSRTPSSSTSSPAQARRRTRSCG